MTERPCQFPRCEREALPFRQRCAVHLGEPLPVEPREAGWVQRMREGRLAPKDMTRAA